MCHPLGNTEDIPALSHSRPHRAILRGDGYRRDSPIFSMFASLVTEEPATIISLSRMLQIDHHQIRDQFPNTRSVKSADLGSFAYPPRL
jgi:hypothetical protein